MKARQTKIQFEVEKELDKWRRVIISSFQKNEVYTGEEIIEILKNNGVLI